MLIKSITISAEASKSYQKYVFSVSAEEVTSKEDLESLRSLSIREALKGINDLTKDVVSSEPAKVEVRESKPVQQSQPYNGYNKRPERPATEAQINWLINNGEFTKERSLMSSKELGLLIADLKAKHYQQY